MKPDENPQAIQHGSDPACDPGAAAPSRETLLHLCYRFLWPFRYFRDVTRGSLLERQLNYRHNRAMRVYLPGFVVKWILLTVVWFTFGSAFDRAAGLVIPAACCYMTGSWTLIVSMVLATSWIWLERFPELYERS